MRLLVLGFFRMFTIAPLLSLEIDVSMIRKISRLRIPICNGWWSCGIQ